MNEEARKNRLYTSYHDNGQKKLEGNYKDGKKDGIWYKWDENALKLEEGN